MNVSTLKRSALLFVLGVGALCAGAQTFVYDGVIYKASGTKLTAQKPGTKTTVGDAAPDAYAGDIVVPLTIEYGGKTYTVTSIAGVFKEQTGVTSIDIADGITIISRGCFQGCTGLVKAKLPADLATMNGDLFSGCTSLEEIVVPGTVKECASNQFKDCTALKKITIADGPTAIEFSAAAFAGDRSANLEVVQLRALGTKYTDMATKPWRSYSGITKVTIGGSFKDIPASYFEGAKNLTEVVFENEPTSFGTNLFAGTPITEMTVPASITAISASCFQGCTKLQKVVLGDAVTSIQDMAFLNSTLSEINLPAGLKTIGQMAFSGAKLGGALVIPDAVTSIGLQAYANNALESVTLGAAVKTVGDGAFMGCTKIAKYAVAAGNENFAATGDMLTSADGSVLYAFAPACTTAKLEGAITELKPYAAYKAAGLTEVNLPSCNVWGDYALAGTSIKTLAVSGTIGRYVAANCPALESISIDAEQVPFGIVADCPAVNSVNLVNPVTVVKQDAFKNCTSLKNLNLGELLSILEADAFTGSGLENLTVTAPNPAAMAEGVFASFVGKLNVNVPVDCAAAYKAATGWKELNIAGDANLAAGPKDMGMPKGLYYAGDDNKLHAVYADGGTDEYEVGTGIPHTFQLAEFANRIYGACAGKKFVYSATGSVDGDGQLFYISQIGGKTFQAVVYDNTGNNAYVDPFSVAISDNILYVNDRNVCIRKVSPDAIALDSKTIPSWMENNWMGYYGAPWSYGCIKAGWAITQEEDAKGETEPLYWVGMKYNGNGIYNFKEEHIGSSDKVGVRPDNGAFLTAVAPIFTTFCIDETNDDMYIYIEKAGSGQDKDNIIWGGLYRLKVSDLKENPEPNVAQLKEMLQLIDGSPVKYEGSAANEHVGISQLHLNSDGYMYWCYRAPSEAEAATNEAQDLETANAGKYFWADKYDSSNPLHQSGIKRIKLGEANPTVEMVAPGASGYGVVAVDYATSTKPDSGVNDVIAGSVKADIIVANNTITATADATVVVYNMRGEAVVAANLAAGESLSIANLANGAYIATANGVAAKFVK